MAQKYISYSFSGYRYAPESFRAFKRICGGDCIEISLSSDQRSTVGYLYVTTGTKGAVDYIKRIEREREHKYRLYVSYGFRTQEDSSSYLYIPELCCRDDAPPSEKVEILRMLRQLLKKTGGRVEMSVRCEFDELFRPTNIVRNYSIADFNQPVKIRLKAA